MTDNKALETARYWLNEFGGVEPLDVLSRDLFHVSRALVALVADKPGAEVAGEEQVRSEQGERASTPSSPTDAELELVEALEKMYRAFNAKKPIPKAEGDAFEIMCSDLTTVRPRSLTKQMRIKRGKLDLRTAAKQAKLSAATYHLIESYGKTPSLDAYLKLSRWILTDDRALKSLAAEADPRSRNADTSVEPSGRKIE